LKPFIISLLLICSAIAVNLFVTPGSLVTGNEQLGNHGTWTSGASAALLLIALIFLLSSRYNSSAYRKGRRRVLLLSTAKKKLGLRFWR
jgi:hypothetical protein